MFAGFIKFCLKVWFYQILLENVCKDYAGKKKIAYKCGFIKFYLKMPVKILPKKCGFIKFCMKMCALGFYQMCALGFYQILPKNVVLSNFSSKCGFIKFC